MLEIKKKGSKNFYHYWVTPNETYVFSAGDLRAMTDGNKFILRSTSGQVIFKKEGFSLNEIKVYDIGGSAENFASFEALTQRLINLGYPAYGDYIGNGEKESSVDIKDFGAKPGVDIDQSEEIILAYAYAIENNKKLIFSGDEKSEYFYINKPLTFSSSYTDIEFIKGTYFKISSELLVPITIGGNNKPTRMRIDGMRIVRDSYIGLTENYGFKFLACNQSSFLNFESRYSKYNFSFRPTDGGFAYNNIINPQAVGGYYNYWLDAVAPGFCNDNKFIGGRGFSTPNLNTHLVLEEYEVNHNTFLSMSLEGAGQQSILVKGGSNVIMNPRTEGSWVNGGVVLDVNSSYNTVETTRYDGEVTDLNYPNGRNQIRSYYNGTQIVTAQNGESSIKAVRLGASNGKPASLVHDIDSTTGDDYINEWMHSRESDESYVFKSIRKTGDLIRAFLKTNGSMFLSRSLEIGQTAWNFKPLKIGIYHLWFEAGNLLIKTSAPTSALDGKFVQLSQSSVPAGFNTAGNSVNSTGKYIGKMVFDTSTNRPVFATGSLSTSAWNFADGTLAYTPV